MTTSVRRSQGSALVGIVLLIVAVALAVVAIFFIRENKPAAPNTPTPTSAPEKTAKPASKTNTEATRNKVAETGINAPKKSEKGIDFTVACVEGGSSARPLAGLVVNAAPAIPTGLDREHLATATTDAEGVAHFSKMPYTIYEVWAAPNGLVSLNQRGIKDGRRVEFVFTKGVPFSGTLVDGDTGTAISGGYVQVSTDFGAGAVKQRIQKAIQQGVPLEEIDGHEKLADPPSYFRTDTTSDDQGHFQFVGIPAGAKVVVNIDHSDYDGCNETVETKDSASVTREYKLVRRTEIFGKVVADETGEPMVGVKVQAGQRGIPVNVFSFLKGGGDSEDVVESTTDANGNFRLKKMIRGKQYLFVRYPGRDDLAAQFEANSGEPCQHDVRLKRAAGMSGQVVDNANNPIEGVAIYWVYPQETILGKIGLPPEPATKTAADGTFQLRGLPPGRSFNVLARHPDFVNAEQDHFVLQPGEEMTKVQIMMNHGGSITGSVVDSSHQPVVAASIVARPVKPTGPPLTAVSSGKDGSFAVANTQPAMFELTCEAPGYCKATNANVRDVATGVQFVMLKEAVYAGRLLNLDSQPIQKYRVRVRPSDTPQQHDMRTDSIRDKEGKFALKGLTPGLWDFEFSADGCTPLVLTHIAVKEGEHVENQDLRVHDGSTMGGIVKSLSGKPIQAALVRMDFLESFSSSDKTYTSLQTSTNAEGSFEIKHLLPGRYKMWVTHPAFAPTGERELVVEEGAPGKQDFNLSKPASLRVVVRDDDGNTVPDAEAWLFQGNTPMSSAEKKVGPNGVVGISFKTNNPERSGIANGTDQTNRGRPRVKVGESGEITFTHKEPGDWTLWITAENHYKYTARLTLEAGKEQVHEAQLLKLKPGLDRQEAYRNALADTQHPAAQFGRKHTGSDPNANPNARQMEKLTPEQRVVLRKQRDGEELTADDMKTLKEARKIMRGEDDEGSSKDSKVAKHHKPGAGGGAGQGGGGAGGDMGGGKKGKKKNNGDPNAAPKPGKGKAGKPDQGQDNGDQR